MEIQVFRPFPGCHTDLPLTHPQPLIRSSLLAATTHALSQSLWGDELQEAVLGQVGILVGSFL